MRSSEEREKLLIKLLGPEKSGQMRSYGFGPTSSQVQALKKQKKMVDEKVSKLVNSIREGLREELKSEMRSLIEEVVRKMMHSLMNDDSEAGDDAATSLGDEEN